MIETLVDTDRVSESDVIRADEIGSLQGDEERAFGGSWSDALDRGELTDRFVIGKRAQLGLR